MATYIPRWGHDRKHWESSEKSSWEQDFFRLLHTAAPLPETPRPRIPEPEPRPAPEELFRNLREKLSGL